MSSKKVLGRGLSNFVKDSEKAKEMLSTDNLDSGNLMTLSIDDVVPNPAQARTIFNEEALEELSASIVEYGILQPLIVRKDGEKYEIVAGERRYRAAKKANIKEVPVIIKDISKSDSEKISLIENIQREDLSPIEEALGYKSILDEYNLTQENLAAALGKSRSYISNTMRLLKLDPRVIEFIKGGQLTSSHGKLLLKISDYDEQYNKAMKIINEGSTVQETISIISPPKKPKPRDNYVGYIEEKLMEALGTKVLLKGAGKNRKVEIEYYSDEDLHRIMEIILGVDELE